MPIVRYQIRNEYGLADPGLYGAADKGDPEALLEGVAMAGLVGILRQLGDLAEFAAEIFHDLHEEVMATSSRGHGLLLRVQQLEAEFPAVEKGFFNLKEKAQLNSNSGVDWHPNLHIDQNLVTREDMPRFILDCYEESRGPPRLFMLDKFDSAEDGACLKRYSDPSFFKMNFVSGGNVEADYHPERGYHKNKKRMPRGKNGVTSDFHLPLPADDKSELLPVDQTPDNQYEQVKHVRLKKRQLNLKIDIEKKYLESILDSQSAEVLALPETSVNDSQKEIHAIMPVESLPQERDSSADVPNWVLGFKEKTLRNSLNASQKMDVQNSINTEEMLEKKRCEPDNKKPLLLADRYQMDVSHSSDSKLSSSLNDYRTDDVASELENYLDALATMESEIETDGEAKSKQDRITFIKEYPNLGSNDEHDHLPEPIFYSGDDSFPNKEVSNGACEKSLNFHELLPSQCSSEEPPCIIKDREGACAPDYQGRGDISGDECSGDFVVNDMKSSTSVIHTVDSVVENNKSAVVDQASAAGEIGETSDVCDCRENMPVDGSAIQEFEMNSIPSDLVEDQKQNDELGDANPLLRLGNSIVFSGSPADQADLNLKVADNENSRIESSNSDSARASLLSDAESTSSHAADKDSQLAFPKVENHELEDSSFCEPRADHVESAPSPWKSEPIVSVDDKSSTPSAVGLLETRDLLDHVLSSDDDDTCVAYSGKLTQTQTITAGKSCEEYFIAENEKAMVNDSHLESDEPTIPDADASSEKHSFGVSDSNSGEPVELSEKNVCPSEEGKTDVSSIDCQKSLNPFLQNESESEISVVGLLETLKLESTSDHKDNACHLKENEADEGASSNESPSASSESLPLEKSSPKKDVSACHSLKGSSEAAEKSTNEVELSHELSLSEIPDSLLKSETKLVQMEPSELLPLDEDPPPPPLPPIQWRMGKLRPSLFPSMEGMKSTSSPSSDQSCGSPLMASSLELQRIEIRQEFLGTDVNESSPILQPPSIHPIYIYPEPSNPFLSPKSTETERRVKEMIIEGYFSDTSLSREAASRSLLGYQGYHMYASEDERFSREEYQRPTRRPSSLLNRPRDPLIEAVAAHDKSTLRRVSEMAQTSAKSNDETNDALLEQIRKKSFNLKPAPAAKPIMKAPPTNLKVAAILEKANAIRQAVAGSDEDDDGDSWSDS
ncbi:SCAR homolog 2 [Wolffia australiana]